MLDKVLSTAEDLVLVGSAQGDKMRFAFPLKGEVAEHYFNQSPGVKNRDLDGFDRYWEYDLESGLIIGSNTPLTLGLDEVVRPDGFSVPSVEEARVLDKEGKLTKGVYRVYGIVIFNGENPNSEIAQKIIEQAGDRKLPFVIPFSAMTHQENRSLHYGISVSLTDTAEGLRSGRQAEEMLNSFDYKGNSGAQGVGRDSDGGWGACWGRFGSSSVGRVDWLCGEATRAELSNAFKQLMERKYDKQIRELTAERDKRTRSFLEELGE